MNGNHQGRPAPKTSRPKDARRVHSGPVFDVWQWEQALFDGSRRTFELLSRRDTVLVLPVTKQDEVLLAREAQPGVVTRVHTIGGRVEDGELPADAAGRELTEEAGLEAARIVLWTAWQPISKIDWAVYIYWASGLTERYYATPDGGEKIDIVRVPLDNFLHLTFTDDIDDAELIHCLARAHMYPRERSKMISTLRSAQKER